MGVFAHSFAAKFHGFINHKFPGAVRYVTPAAGKFAARASR
jgi:hypothetical protein